MFGKLVIESSKGCQAASSRGNGGRRVGLYSFPDWILIAEGPSFLYNR
jgi:hypothetical protein